MVSVSRSTLVVPPHEIDIANRLKASALFHFIQGAAAAHAEALQLEYESLRAAGLFWVLSWVRLEVETYPQLRDSISIETWPQSRYKLFSLRDFLFIDNQQHIFARARTAWLLVYAAAKRITSLDRLPRPVPYQEDRRAMDTFPQKIPPAERAETIYEKRIGYT
ncbi:MAG: hypothetical protein EHM70_14295, partial [Chloroflexota bacterium]